MKPKGRTANCEWGWTAEEARTSPSPSDLFIFYPLSYMVLFSMRFGKVSIIEGLINEVR